AVVFLLRAVRAERGTAVFVGRRAGLSVSVARQPAAQPPGSGASTGAAAAHLLAVLAAVWAAVLRRVAGVPGRAAAGALPVAGPGAGGGQPGFPHQPQAGHRLLQQRLHRVQPQRGLRNRSSRAELRPGRQNQGHHGYYAAHAAQPTQAASQKASCPRPASGAAARKPAP
nr:hypothetical protein [Tanacetum cinerariifolium]